MDDVRNVQHVSDIGMHSGSGSRRLGRFGRPKKCRVNCLILNGQKWQNPVFNGRIQL